MRTTGFLKKLQRFAAKCKGKSKGNSSSFLLGTGFNAKLENCTLEATPKFTWKTEGKVLCKILNVYDGDTLDIAMEHAGDVYQFRVRLAGLDTPELKPVKSTPNREAIIESGIDAKNFLASLILHKVLPIEITGQDKYGRLLGIIYVDNTTNVTVNTLLITSGHAVAYDGGTKEHF